MLMLIYANIANDRECWRTSGSAAQGVLDAVQCWWIKDMWANLTAVPEHPALRLNDATIERVKKFKLLRGGGGLTPGKSEVEQLEAH